MSHRAWYVTNYGRPHQLRVVGGNKRMLTGESVSTKKKFSLPKAEVFYDRREAGEVASRRRKEFKKK